MAKLGPQFQVQGPSQTVQTTYNPPLNLIYRAFTGRSNKTVVTAFFASYCKYPRRRTSKAYTGAIVNNT